jgi:hypothetical protein
MPRSRRRVVLSTFLLTLFAPAADATEPPPPPTLTFKTTIRVAEAYSTSPGSGPQRDGCLAATARLASPIVSKIVFDGVHGRMSQSNAMMVRTPTTNLTNIGRWDLPTPQEWDLESVGGGSMTCYTEALPDAVCPNGTKACPPTFGSWGELNPFTSILGMWYPNTSLVVDESTPTYDTYRLVDVRETLIPNDGCGTPSCTMKHCSTCNVDTGTPCKTCPCKKCIQKIPITRNYTYHVAKKESADGTRGLLRYSWTQGIPLTKEGGPGFGRDCFIFDWGEGWTTDIKASDFAPPKDVQCTPRVHQ